MKSRASALGSLPSPSGRRDGGEGEGGKRHTLFFDLIKKKKKIKKEKANPHPPRAGLGGPAASRLPLSRRGRRNGAGRHGRADYRRAARNQPAGSVCNDRRRVAVRQDPAAASVP